MRRPGVSPATAAEPWRAWARRCWRRWIIWRPGAGTRRRPCAAASWRWRRSRPTPGASPGWPRRRTGAWPRRATGWPPPSAMRRSASTCG
ncbi:hypothetical protein TSO352_05155 [Azospirillum sp. TSO35-2]|nr:hypothetical protein TSO352_05155 [Azospirillum sp. TSO35-2]